MREEWEVGLGWGREGLLVGWMGGGELGGGGRQVLKLSRPGRSLG